MKQTYLTILATLGLVPSVYSYELVNNDLAYLDFYGEVKARALIKENEKDDYTLGDSKVGLLGKYALRDELNVLGGVESEVNLSSDENVDKDDLYLSQYFLGLDSPYFGAITAGKHSTSSDDFDGVDYSEVYGGRGNLNSVGVKTDTIKYRLNREFYQVSATYGFESGDQNRDLAELFVKYLNGDLTFIGGLGTSSTNTSNSRLDILYSQFSGFLDLGDYQFGSTLYYNTTDDKLTPAKSVDSVALNLGGRLMIIHNMWTYAGYEMVNRSSDTQSLDGTLHNTYLGLAMRYVEWLKLYAEINYENDSVATDDAFNFGGGFTVTW